MKNRLFQISFELREWNGDGLQRNLSAKQKQIVRWMR